MTASELRELREKAKVSRAAMAARTASFSATMIQRIEEGERDMPEDYEAACLMALDEITAERRGLVEGAMAGAA